MTVSRRRATHLATVSPDPLAEAVFTDTLGIADDLGEVLDALKGFDASTIRGLLFRKPPSGIGQFQYIDAIPAPIDMAAVMDHLKENYGGGEYRLQIFAAGKTRKNIEFQVYGTPKAPKAGGLAVAGGAPGADMSMGNFLQLMLAQQAEARREAAEQRRQDDERASRRERDQAERQARRDETMWRTIGLIAPVAVPLLLADKREKLSEIVAMLQAGKGEGSNLKDQVETLAALKTLFGDGDKSGGGIDPDDLLGSIGRLAGPLASAAARRFGPRDSAADPVGADPAAQPAAPLSLPGPAAPPMPAASPAQLAAAGPVDRILDVVGPDVAFMFARGYDPDEAAEIVANRIDAAGVGEDELNALVAEFLASPDWLGDLARRGLDLRPNPTWAQHFLSALIALFQAEPDDATGDDGHNDTGRRGRSAPDAEDHGAPGAGGQPPH